MANLFFGGIPVEADVNRLMEVYVQDNLQPGYKISYSDVSSVINQNVRTSRWKTVTNAWRKRIENDYNIIIDCIPNEACFVVLSEGGKVQLSRRKLRSSVRLARRSISVSGRINLAILSKEDRKEHDFNCNKAAAIISSGQLRNNNKQLPEMTGK